MRWRARRLYDRLNSAPSGGAQGMQQQARPRAIITGAADGIGKALAWRAVKAGYAIVGIDNDAQQADATRAALLRAGAQVEFLLADLAHEPEIERVLDGLAAGGPAQLVVQNAGINAVGRFGPGTSTLADQEQVLGVNLLAPLLLTPGLLQRELLAPGAALVFISSLSHFVGYPGAAVYAASKDGLASYARSLTIELAPQQIHVLTVFPGPTRTAHAHRYSPDNRREQRRMPPEQLANAIFHAVERRQQVLIPGATNHLLATMGRLLPGVADGIMQRTQLDPLDK